MKAKVLYILVPVLLIQNIANAVEVYNKNGNKLDMFGKVTGMHFISNNDKFDGDRTYVRIGFRGETQINDQVTGYGHWEYQIQGNNNENNKNFLTRTAFAGLKFNNSSSLDYGRNYGIMYDIASWTNINPGFGNRIYSPDNFMQSRANNVITYRNKDFFGIVNGLDFALQYQGKNAKISSNKEDIYSSVNILQNNGEGYGASILYEIGEGLSVGGALSSSKRTADQQHSQTNNIYGNGNRAEVYSSGIKYNANNIYLAAQFSQSYNATSFGNLPLDKSVDNIYGFANKAKMLELVAQYQFDFGLKPSIAYLQSKGKNISDSFKEQNLLKYVDLGATYYFNNNMSTYVDYKINLMDVNDFTKKAGITTDNMIALGLVYQF